ncbi:MAG: DUF1653 domain-containing protein [Candidatus Ventricola sp.]
MGATYMETRMQPGDIVRHFKGRYYEILCFARDSETQAEVVVYRALYGERGVWVRPREMFFSPVDRDKYPDAPQAYRFERAQEAEHNER